TEQQFVIHPATTLGYVHLTTADLEPQIAFYQSVLGFKVHGRKDGTASLGAGRDDLLRLTELRGARLARGTTGLYHFAVLVPSRWGLAHLLRRLVETRTPIQGMVNHHTDPAIYIADAEGNGSALAGVFRGEQGAPPPGDAVGLRYFTIVLPRRTELDRLTARVRAAGIGGEEHAEGMLVRDPSHNGVLLTARTEPDRAE